MEEEEEDYGELVLREKRGWVGGWLMAA